MHNYFALLPIMATTVLITILIITGILKIKKIGKSQRTRNEYGAEYTPSEDSTPEIDIHYLEMNKVFGSGSLMHFSSGKYQNNEVRKEVIMKTLINHEDASEHEIITEASIIAQLRHRNIIKVIGVVTKTLPNMIILEAAENGFLDEYLSNHNALSMDLLIQMVLGICSAMSYLGKQNIVHRALTAHSIVLDDNIGCKLADFSFALSCIGSAGERDQEKIRSIPVRCCAPEIISDNNFSFSSDVWSYGIVCWEVLTLGQHPYWKWTNNDVKEAIKNGYNLPPPHHCPCQLYTLMQKCWAFELKSRPSFKEINSLLLSLSKTKNEVENYIECGILNPLDPDHKDITEFTYVYELLDYLELEKYNEIFEENGYTQIADLPLLNYTKLIEMRILNSQDLAVIINAIQVVKETIFWETDVETNE